MEEPFVDVVEPAPAERAVPARRLPRVAFGLYWAHLFALFGLAASNSLLGLAVLASPFSGKLRGLGRRAVRPLLAIAALYVVLLGVSIVFSFDPQRSARGMSEVFSLCTLLLGLALLRNERAVRLTLDAVVLLATLESLAGLVQLVAAGGPDLDHRIHGSMSHYMTFSGVLMIADLVLLGRLLAGSRTSDSRGDWKRDWRLWALLPINAALVATLTRSAWVGLAAGVVALLLLARRRLLLWWVPVALLALLLLPSSVLERAASIVDPGDLTNSDRICMAQAGLAMIRERPFVGQGPNMVEERYPLYRLPQAWRRDIPHLHDAFLQVAAERGVPALITLLLLLGLPAARALAAYRREGGRGGLRADLWLGVLGALVAFAVAGLFEDNWGDVEVQRLVLVLLAVPYGLVDDARPEVP
ncbi:MAG TPA: O-antigen ligase family protein [Thermoanaerobaculia bacterium]|nr:O-antigen ligase family protein [Thermoanaerobaculia bacterium]